MLNHELTAHLQHINLPVTDQEDARSFKSYTLKNFRQIPQLGNLPEEELFSIEVVGRVFPFRVNNYVIEQLIDWDKAPNDPLFRLTFPQKGMLLPQHFDEMAGLLKSNASKAKIAEAVRRIRLELNPHPAGQIEHNLPELNGKRLAGLQHKYNETLLFFPNEGQVCHAYCTYCFRWPQFGEDDSLKLGMSDASLLVEYIRQHKQISDVLITGGDPLTMKVSSFARYIQALLDANLPNLKTIRIGTKTLTYWPYRFTTDQDADELLRLFRRVVSSGKHLAIMAHFNHPNELQTKAVVEAVRRIRETGAVIRTQAPMIRGINDDADTWASLWRRQVALGMIPYYMFLARDTGAQHHFRVSLVRAWEIFRDAYAQVSGICRTVRGPSMSTHPGKVQMLGVATISGMKVFVLRFLQGRNPDWVQRPFFAQYDENAFWLDDLKPVFGEEKFFYEDELELLGKNQEAAVG